MSNVFCVKIIQLLMKQEKYVTTEFKLFFSRWCGNGSKNIVWYCYFSLYSQRGELLNTCSSFINTLHTHLVAHINTF